MARTPLVVLRAEDFVGKFAVPRNEPLARLETEEIYFAPGGRNTCPLYDEEPGQRAIGLEQRAMSTFLRTVRELG